MWNLSSLTLKGELRIKAHRDDTELFLGDRWGYNLVYGYHSVSSVKREIVASIRKHCQMVTSGEYPVQGLDS